MSCESLRRAGSDLAAHLGAPAPLDFGNWREVADALLALGRDRPVPVVIDEFPYLVRARKTGDLAHPLNVLQDCWLVTREPDAFKDNRSPFRIAEPLITFYHAAMRPIWSDLEHTRDASLLWQRSQRRFTSNVLGPHFEQICRYWTRHFVAEETVGGIPVRVETATVHDVGERTTTSSTSSSSAWWIPDPSPS
jgi:hypothetical protein